MGLSRSLLAAALALLSATAAAVEPIEIPKSAMWTYSTRGTQRLRDLDPRAFPQVLTPDEAEAAKAQTKQELEAFLEYRKKSPVWQIVQSMGRRVAVADKQSKPGFAVEGEGRDAISGVLDVLVKNDAPRKTLSTRGKVSVVFFSNAAQPYVAVEKVRRSGNKVMVYYTVASHGHMDLTWELALIPLGSLPAGKYDVEVLRSPNAKDQPGFPSVEPNIEKYIVCRPFSFVVE